MSSRTTLCVACGAVLTSGGRLCRDDAENVMVQVRNAHDLLRDLDVTLMRMDKVTPSSVGGRAAETPLPFSIAASHAATELRGAIRGMGARAGGPDAQDLRRFREAKARAMEAVDAPDPRVFIGTCDCGKALYARSGESAVVCRSCREEYEAVPLDSWREVRRLSAPIPKLREWLLHLGVARSRAQLYRDCSRLEPQNSTGERVYLLSDVLDQVVRTKARQQQRAS